MSSQDSALSTDRCVLPDGRRLAYTTCGPESGTPVLAHHGTPGSRLFAALLSGTASDAGIRLLVPDRPGYGRSSPPPDGWTWDDWQRDVTELVHAESLDEAAVLGFSGGGPFALAAATGDWATRVALVGSVVPPADNGLTRLAGLPLVPRAFFRLSEVLARVRGPAAVVAQYTDRPVSEAVRTAVAADFHEAFHQGAAAVVRENRLFGSKSLDSIRVDGSLRAWHGTRDRNTPLASIRSFVDGRDGTVLTRDVDHLGIFLDCRREAFGWLREG